MGRRGEGGKGGREGKEGVREREDRFLIRYIPG